MTVLYIYLSKLHNLTIAVTMSNTVSIQFAFNSKVKSLIINNICVWDYCLFILATFFLVLNICIVIQTSNNNNNIIDSEINIASSDMMFAKRGHGCSRQGSTHFGTPCENNADLRGSWLGDLRAYTLIALQKIHKRGVMRDQSTRRGQLPCG